MDRQILSIHNPIALQSGQKQRTFFLRAPFQAQVETDIYIALHTVYNIVWPVHAVIEELPNR